MMTSHVSGVPGWHGAVEKVIRSGGLLRGWVRNEPGSSDRLQKVRIFLNGSFLGEVEADQDRADFGDAQRPSGFSFLLPSASSLLPSLRIEIYAEDGRQLINSPLSLSQEEVSAIDWRYWSSEPPKGTVALVAGMHRSGTSALTRVLSLLGLNLPDNLIPPATGDNPTGFWEPSDVVNANNRALTAIGSHWIDSRRPRFSLADIETLRDIENEIAQIAASWSAASVIKDPRLSVLLPIWLPVLSRLGLTAKVVMTLRHPTACAASLRERNGLPPEVGEAVWLRYMLEAEVASRTVPRYFVAYDDLLTDWEQATRRVREAFDLNPVRPKSAQALGAFLDADLRHHPQRECRLPDADAVFRILKRGARREDWPTLDGIRNELNQAERFYGGHARLLPLIVREFKSLEKRTRAEEAKISRDDKQGSAAESRSSKRRGRRTT